MLSILVIASFRSGAVKRDAGLLELPPSVAGAAGAEGAGDGVAGAFNVALDAGAGAAGVEGVWAVAGAGVDGGFEVDDEAAGAGFGFKKVSLSMTYGACIVL